MDDDPLAPPATYDELYGPGETGGQHVSPDDTPAEQGKHRPGDTGDTRDTDARRVRWTAAELLAHDFPEVRWAIPGLVPEGLTALVGGPKVGKSWLALRAGGVAVGALPPGGCRLRYP